MTSKTTRNPFDLPVDGMHDRYLTMQELMARYASCKGKQDWEGAKAILEYGADCCYLPAKLELARLLRSAPALKMPQNQRFARAESLYRELLCTIDLPERAAASVALELGTLYGDCLNRPVGCLAMLLQAKRHGANVPNKDIELCRHRLNRMDINTFGCNARDAYELGSELCLAGGSTRLAEFFLREAAETDDRTLRGMACLALADFYNDHQQTYRTYRGEAARCYRLAADCGFPDCLSK